MLDEKQIRELVSEVLVLRGTADWRDEEEQLLTHGDVQASQIGGADADERARYLRSLSPVPLLLMADTETGTGFARNGIAVPPLMALGAADDEKLAGAWATGVALEARRIGLDITWSPVLDVNVNPANPIINVRSLGQDETAVGRLGAALVRGFLAGGIHPCAKHWPGHGDVAVDSHISLASLAADQATLERREWLPYRSAVEAGLESVMTGHLLVPAIDAEHCATVSAELIGLLKRDLGVPGPVFTDSLGMEGLRTTVDSAEAAWRALAAGHDMVLIDYKRPPAETFGAVCAACRDGRLTEARLRDAVRRVRRMKARRATVPPLPADGDIRNEMQATAHQVAAAAVTPWNWQAPPRLTGTRTHVVICDDLQRRAAAIADESRDGAVAVDRHPAAQLVRQQFTHGVTVLSEAPDGEELEQALGAAASAEAVVGFTFARISSYKGSGVRLPAPQRELWQRLAARGHLQALLLFESPYAAADLPAGVPILIGYGADRFSLQAAVDALTGKAPAPGRLPVSVPRGSES